jgi:hypothetical protein
MNVHQKPKHAVYFARQWLEDVLTQCRQIAGLLQHFRTNGHINARYTSLNMEDEDIRKYKLEYLLRIEINKAMWQEKDKFMEHWNALGHIIYEYSDKYGDEFNKQYESKRKKH